MYSKIVNILNKNSFDVYIVGGYVRDYLIGNRSKDIDLVTNATYEELHDLFKHEKISHVGSKFKVMIINGIEVSSYRTDIYDDSDKLIDVTPAPSLEEDLSRRDLTINAIAMDPFTEKIIDPFNGKHDLKSKKIKFVGNPQKRIKEDPVRIIRACRFISDIDGIFDPETFFAMKSSLASISDIPKERITKEILKAMKTQNASKFFNALRNIGLLQMCIPTFNDCINLDGGKYHAETVYDHLMMAGDYLETDDPVFKLAAYLHDIGKGLAYQLNCDGTFNKHDKLGMDIAENELKKLKFSNEDIAFIKDVIQFHMYDIDSCMYNDIKIRKFLNKIESRKFSSKYTYEHFLDIFDVDHKANMKKDNILEMGLYKLRIKNVLEKKQPITLKDLAINGNDVMQILNIKPDKFVGEILNELFQYIIEYPESNTKEMLIQILKEKYVF